MREGGKNMVHLGDDTWHALFPGYFDANLTHAYESLNVWDLHTVDDGVTKHLLPLLSGSEISTWDVTFGHYLGVDHVGHQYGPDHPSMASKLKQMDDVLREIIAILDSNTLLVVMGDHGMDSKGDHGGESDEEVEAAMWMFSKKGIFGRENDMHIQPPKTAKERPIRQIDLVPTLSLLLGLPIPFNNLGAPIAEAFMGPRLPNWKNLATVSALTAAQIKNYEHHYSTVRKLDSKLFITALNLWSEAQRHWHDLLTKKGTSHEYEKVFDELSSYQKETLRIFKTLWAIFDLYAMIQGIFILISTVFILVCYARSSTLDLTNSTPVYLRYAWNFSIIGCIFGVLVAAVTSKSIFDSCLLGFAGGGFLGFVFIAIQMQNFLRFPIPNSTWGWLSLIFTFSQAAGFASNSYTIWEDEILLFFLSTFTLFGIFSSLRQAQVAERLLGVSQSTIFLLLTRLASVSRLCREEQMPTCRSTYYASSTSSTSAPWQVSIPFLLALFLPNLINSYFVSTRSLTPLAINWICFAFRLGLLGSAMFWIVDAIDTAGWIRVDSDLLKLVKTSLAQLVLAIACIAGTAIYIWTRSYVSGERPALSANSPEHTEPSKLQCLTLFEKANVHGTRYFTLITSWGLGIILLQKPMGGGVIGILIIQILALLEIVQVNNLSMTAIGPVILALLGSFHFFKTGHQATLSSIQWDSAFIPLRSIIYPWSPLFVVLNTFGAQILTAIAVPLTAVWKQPPRKRLLEAVAKAVATHILYYAVINLATTMWAGWLRRHLMLYRVFSPRFLTGAAVLFIVDLVAVFVAFVGVRWNFLIVAEDFGWE